MANACERLSALPPEAFAARLQQELSDRYGRWQHAEGTALTPSGWFATLAQAVQAEAPDWPTAVLLCRFALAEEAEALPKDSLWTNEMLTRPTSAVILSATLAALRPEATATPEDAKEFLREVRHLLRASHGLRGQEVMETIRAALTGMQRGPCLGIVVALLGAVRTRQRLEEQLTCLQSA